jgi:hypothetical protein
MLSPKPAQDDALWKGVYRLKAADDGTGPWERRVLELCDGRPLSEIIHILYREEVRKGAWLADIGLWRNLFDQSVIDTIAGLIDRGYINPKLIFGGCKGIGQFLRKLDTQFPLRRQAG